MRAGFSLVEFVIALSILGVAVLAMGASTGRAMAQIQASQLQTERMEAVRLATESLRASVETPSDWASLPSDCAKDPYVSTENYDVTCIVTTAGVVSQILLVTDGPAFISGQFLESVRDATFSIRIEKPVD